MTLDRCGEGYAGRVTGILLPDFWQRRLCELGMVPGCTIRVVRKKGHGETILHLRGARYAVGAGIVRGIFVSEKKF